MIPLLRVRSGGGGLSYSFPESIQITEIYNLVQKNQHNLTQSNPIYHIHILSIPWIIQDSHSRPCKASNEFKLCDGADVNLGHQDSPYNQGAIGWGVGLDGTPPNRWKPLDYSSMKGSFGWRKRWAIIWFTILQTNWMVLCPKLSNYTNPLVFFGSMKPVAWASPLTLWTNDDMSRFKTDTCRCWDSLRSWGSTLTCEKYQKTSSCCNMLQQLRKQTWG